MIVRWRLTELPALLEELRVQHALLIASKRWSDLDLGVPIADRWSEVPSARIADVAARAGDGIIAVGGGSAIDLGKAASAEAGVPLISVPTTYAGAEWTSFFGIRDPDRRMKGGGSGAQLAGVVYEPTLTVSLPPWLRTRTPVTSASAYVETVPLKVTPRPG